MIAPVFEELARAKAQSGNGIAFAKIDLDVGMGSSVAREWSVRVTPTFVFLLDGKKVCGFDDFSHTLTYTQGTGA